MTHKPPRKKILVTGAGGLIGARVVQKLAQYQVNVLAVDMSEKIHLFDHAPYVHWSIEDILSPSFLNTLEDSEVDLILHCAAHPGGLSLKEPVTNVEVNVLGSMKIFEWCAQHKVPVIYLSSSVVYGEQPYHPILEEAQLNPLTVYGACKVACEQFLKILAQGYGLEYTVLRLFTTYGAGHTPNLFQGIVNIMLTQLLQGNQLVVKGSLKRIRDIIYVDDVADAIIKVLFSSETRGHIYNLGTGSAYTIEELITILVEVLGENMQDINIIVQEGTVGDPFYNVPDTTRLTSVIDFHPNHTLQEGITKLIKNRMV